MSLPSVRGRVIREDGTWVLALRPVLRGFRLQEFSGHKAGRYWCYDSSLAAVAAAEVWDGSCLTEPVGWLLRGGVALSPSGHGATERADG